MERKVEATNPLMGLSANERKRILANLNSSSNSNSAQQSPRKNQTQKNVSYRNAVFAVNPFASPETKAYMEEKKRAYYNQRRAQLPQYKPSETAVAFKQAVLNRIAKRKAEEEKAKRNAERMAKYPPVFAKNPYPGLNLSNLNTNSSNTSTNRNRAGKK